MNIPGFFLMLTIAILVRWLGIKLVPLLMPGGRLKTIAVGWAGGFAASWVDGVLWQFGPQVTGINLVAAVIGCILFILGLGVAPFVKTMLGGVKPS